jgi:glucans biosynthesis protein
MGLGVAAWAKVPAFDEATVPALARELAARPYAPPPQALPPSLAAIGYDQYRDYRFKPSQALWRGGTSPFQVQFFHRGYLFKDRVDVAVVEAGRATPVRYSPALFAFGPQPVPDGGDMGFAGFRVHGAINQAGVFDEIFAFLGASYFRAVGRGQQYGLSARGLALGSGDDNHEEFPVFRSFWIEKPEAGDATVVVHALLDGPSASAAFRFEIEPGEETVFDTRMRLYPRVAIANAGIAPLTSMFHFSANDGQRIDDFRAAAHDSDGLALHTGRGEQVWRPLRNPHRVQHSFFQDRAPRGFGLLQRKRAFADFADIEAAYQRRPSLWVEPRGDWGAGAVVLVEIPTGHEYQDNIVAFWRPAEPLAPGREYRFDYRLHWGTGHAGQPDLATVAATRTGPAATPPARRLVVDLAGGRRADPAQVRAVVEASRGQVARAIAQPNPDTGGWRLSFEYTPEPGAEGELRALLVDDLGPLSETWLYRWHP